MKSLTSKQQKVLSFIRTFRGKAGFPPTIREIARGLGFRSINNARQHVQLIQRKGYLKLAPGRARGIEVPADAAFRQAPESGVPLLGVVAAGKPLLAVENIEGNVVLDRSIFRGQGLFAFRIKGDSMKNIGVLDRDIIIVRQAGSVEPGEIAVVCIEGEATLKRYIPGKNRVILRAENPRYPDIVVASDKDARIIGKLIGVMRKY
jgi:repressor LexA